MEPDLKAFMKQRLAGYEEVAKLQAKELANLTEEDALKIIERLRVYTTYPERDPRACGLIEQQAIFTKARSC